MADRATRHWAYGPGVVLMILGVWHGVGLRTMEREDALPVAFFMVAFGVLGLAIGARKHWALYAGALLLVFRTALAGVAHQGRMEGAVSLLLLAGAYVGWHAVREYRRDVPGSPPGPPDTESPFAGPTT